MARATAERTTRHAPAHGRQPVRWSAQAPPARRNRRARRACGSGAAGSSRCSRSALAVGASGSWSSSSSRSTAPPHGRVTVTIPPDSSSSQIGDPRARRRDLLGLLLRAARDARRRPRRAARRHYDLQQGMSYSAALELLTTAPAGRRRSELTIIEAGRAPQVEARCGPRASRATTCRDPSLAAARLRGYGAPRAHADLEGFLFPDTYQLRGRSASRRWSTDQLKTFKAGVREGQLQLRAQPRPDAVRRADDRLADRGRGGDRPRPAAGRVGDLQPPAARMQLQLDSTVAYATGNYTQAADRDAAALDARRATRVTTWACRRRRSTAPGSRRSRPRPTRRRPTTCTSSSSSAATASWCSRRATTSSSADAQKYQQARSAHGGSRRALLQEAVGGSLTGASACVGWPVAHSRSPAIQNAALAAAGLAGWRYQLLPVPPELFDETVRALPAAGFRGVNVTIPHKEAALALADRRDAAGAGDRRRQHAHVRGRRRDRAPTTPTRPALIAALPALAAGRTALVLGAGGSARAAVWALIDAGAREVRVWNRTPRAPASWPRSSERRAGDQRRAGGHPGQLHVGRTDHDAGCVQAAARRVPMSCHVTMRG